MTGSAELIALMAAIKAAVAGTGPVNVTICIQCGLTTSGDLVPIKVDASGRTIVIPSEIAEV